MKPTPQFATARRSPAAGGDKIISLAILAVGGQGGGVLTDWITQVAEANNYRAQSTSIAGVAQRTGATVYYIEMIEDQGMHPVFALSPGEGDIDILIAAELMEAGRALARGFITPGRTTVITSTHRIAAIAEKMAPADGRASSAQVAEEIEAASDNLIAFDLEHIANKHNSVISASLLGALAGSGALPFDNASYERVIGLSGKGKQASLAAYSEAYKQALGFDRSEIKATIKSEKEAPAAHEPREFYIPDASSQLWADLVVRVSTLPKPVTDITLLALKKVVDYQDLAYGSEFLDRLNKFVELDSNPYSLSQAAAKYISKAMCYDDIIRVADLKTRASRLQNVQADVGVTNDQVIKLTDYFHPRLEEFTSILPAKLAMRLRQHKRFSNWLGRRIDKGRRIRTDRFSGFLLLWLLSLLRPWRRRLARHKTETAHLETWLSLCYSVAQSNSGFSAAILSAHRLIKGYSDTHARGLSKFDKLLKIVPKLKNHPNAADEFYRIQALALADASGDALDKAIKSLNKRDE